LELTLDGKPMRTPAGMAFVLPMRALAEAIAGEWNAVPEKGEIKPQFMPMTRLAATALDRVASQRAKVVEEITAYGRSDLLCYRAERPMELVARQKAVWDQWLEWLKRRHGVTLNITQGVMPVAQDDTEIEKLRRAIASVDDFALAGLFNLTAMLGSVVLALAVQAGELDAERAAAVAEIDAMFQAERWGEDVEATRQREAVRRDIATVGRYLTFLSPSEL
jgi:chaperone required for assembly of F1-ATPase